jgi:4-amino-4-deoxy-L-arabinose transferase-like glycosyltransferase
MLAGKGYSIAYIVNEMPSALVGPVYTAFLYIHFLLFGKNYFFVELSQAMIGSASALVLALIGRRMANERVGIVAGILCAVYPTYAYWCALPFQLTMDVFLIELSILAVMAAMDRQKFGWHLLAGACIGLTALSKSFYLSFLFLYLAWFWIWKRPKLKALVFAAAVWGISAAVVISPWSVRNFRVFHQLVPLTTNGGANLWYGNNPLATGALYTKDGKPMLSVIPEDLLQKIAAAKTEAEKDRLLGEAGRDWIKAHPREFIMLIPLRLRAMWWFDPEMETGFPIVRKAVYVLLLLFAVPGMVVSRKSWKAAGIFYLLCLWETFFYSFFVGQARFRYLIEFGFLFFAACFVIWACQRIKLMSQP